MRLTTEQQQLIRLAVLAELGENAKVICLARVFMIVKKAEI